ncbi:hypothetical protein LIER_01215 [Lithospermum erythrorhizon]|uniref:Uncharacterized protein n=1 Tax=Lithospermum erythrorhizon TaxID=34254 RepID=A0AAV3NLB4_LITER
MVRLLLKFKRHFCSRRKANGHFTFSTVWADADTWFERQQQEEEMQRLQAEQRAAMQVAEDLHRKKMADEREGEKDEDTYIKDDPMAKAEAEVLNQQS